MTSAALQRQQQLAQWFARTTGGSVPTLISLTGDASFRRYFRVAGAAASMPSTAAGATDSPPAKSQYSGNIGDETASIILCDAPPATEKNHEFVLLAAALAASGVRVPTVISADVEHGFLALEDLGDQQLLPLLNEQTVDTYYQQALDLLRRISATDITPGALAHYDQAALEREMALFPEWFCHRLLDQPLNAEALSVFNALQTSLCDRALSQHQVLVHRDYHARNLMVLDDGSLATIDFQDAVIGPISYDAVSLLRDCYVRWPDDRVRAWALHYRRSLSEAGIAVPGEGAFLQDFDWMGLQRHLKVLGIFARLYLRDDKPAYLQDLPRVMSYVLDVLSAHQQEPALADFLDWYSQQILPIARQQDWYGDNSAGMDH